MLACRSAHTSQNINTQNISIIVTHDTLTGKICPAREPPIAIATSAAAARSPANSDAHSRQYWRRRASESSK